MGLLVAALTTRTIDSFVSPSQNTPDTTFLAFQYDWGNPRPRARTIIEDSLTSLMDFSGLPITDLKTLTKVGRNAYDSIKRDPIAMLAFEERLQTRGFAVENYLERLYALNLMGVERAHGEFFGSSKRSAHFYEYAGYIARELYLRTKNPKYADDSQACYRGAARLVEETDYNQAEEYNRNANKVAELASA